MKMFEKHVGLFCLTIALLCIADAAKSQAIPWDTDVVTASAPTTCSDGSALSFCTITGYRVQVSATATATGVFTDVPGDVSTPNKVITGVSAGAHCYRYIALSANGSSVPSNVACTTTVKPTPTPNPPTGLTVDNPTAYNVVPNLKRFVFERGTKYEGFVKTGAACDKTRSVGDGLYVIARLNMVSPRPAPGTVLVAHCS